MSSNETRREFLKHSAQVAGTLAAVQALGGVHTLAAAPEEPVRMAIIGCGGIMNMHVAGLVERKENVSIAWFCDVDPRQIERIAKHTAELPSPQRTGRYEDVLADKSVEACIIATPHHWHAPIAVAAMQAGKDVYIEKPISHSFSEGPLVIEAAKKYGRIAQQGSQMRSSPVTAEAAALLKQGIIGEVKVARAWTAETRDEVKALPDGNPPEGVDYDRWLGPAPVHAFNPHRWHGSWRMFRDYGNGEIGDDGIHDLDMAAWGLAVDQLPSQVTARGGRMMLREHASEYPDNMCVTYEYPDGRMLIYENLPFTAYGMHGFDNGNLFYGTEGYMVFSRRGAFSTFLGPKAKPGPTESKSVRTQKGYAEHMREFLTSVRTRKPTSANPEVAHLSCALVHLAEAAYRTRGRLDFDAGQQKFVDCPEADTLLGKTYREPYAMPAIG